MFDSDQLNVRLPRAHRVALEKLAALQAETKVSILRGLIRREAEERGVWPLVTEEKSLQEEKRGAN